jgi:hypothetical protein
MTRVERIRETLLDLREKIEADAVNPRYSTAAWIFTPTLDLERFVHLLDGMIEEEVGKARVESMEAASQTMALQCACRCRAHRQHGCPLCLKVESCPLHFEPDPTTLER